MRAKQRYIVIADVGTVQNPNNGDRTIQVISGRKVVCKKDLVGVNTQAIATSQNIMFNYSLEIDKNFYNDEKYCYLDNKLYEIKGLTKAKEEQNMLLNVVKIEDANVLNAIQAWLGV